MNRTLPLICLLASPLLVAAPGAASRATYDVTFDASWNALDHSTDFPANAHFSGLVGGTHDEREVFWEPGGVASRGIETMAETGGRFALVSEVEDARDERGTAEFVIQSSGIDTPDSITQRFDIRTDHSQVTLTSMVAPSPDWFVGVHGLDLLENGAWVEEVVVELLPYDAGTDSGSTFTSPNADTDPADPITRITGFPFAGTPPLGTFTFSLVSVDTDEDGMVDGEDNCVEVPNADQADVDAGQDDDSSLPGNQSYGDACDADLNDDGTIGADDFFGGFRPCLGAEVSAQPECREADLDGDGVVGAGDFFGHLRPSFGLSPGPGRTDGL